MMIILKPEDKFVVWNKYHRRTFILSYFCFDYLGSSCRLKPFIFISKKRWRETYIDTLMSNTDIVH